MRLLLIRHGESSNNRLQADTGTDAGRVPDPDLTELGRRQARKLADAFAAGRLPRPDVLLASPMKRAIATAAVLADAVDLPVTVDTALFEVNGVYEGRYVGHATAGTPHPGSPASVLRALSPRLDLPSDVDEAGWYRRPFETPAMARHRAGQAVAALRTRFGATDDLVAIVCHEWIIQFLLRSLLDWPADPDGGLPVWFDVNNTGHVLVRPSVDPDHDLAIGWINRTDHLDADELTT